SGRTFCEARALLFKQIIALLQERFPCLALGAVRRLGRSERTQLIVYARCLERMLCELLFNLLELPELFAVGGGTLHGSLVRGPDGGEVLSPLAPGTGSIHPTGGRGHNVGTRDYAVEGGLRVPQKRNILCVSRN